MQINPTNTFAAVAGTARAQQASTADSDKAMNTTNDRAHGAVQGHEDGPETLARSNHSEDRGGDGREAYLFNDQPQQQREGEPTTKPTKLIPSLEGRGESLDLLG